jgi:hypothetical protein
MRNQYDIAGYSFDRQLVLIADVKAGKETSEENAAHFRRNLLAHGLLAEVPYFLLAYKTQFFLWKGTRDADSRPDYKAAAKPVLEKYLGEIGESARGPGSESLEIAVKSWLSELASGVRAPDTLFAPDQMLVESGLFERLKGGEVLSESTL